MSKTFYDKDGNTLGEFYTKSEIDAQKTYRYKCDITTGSSNVSRVVAYINTHTKITTSTITTAQFVNLCSLGDIFVFTDSIAKKIDVIYSKDLEEGNESIELYESEIYVGVDQDITPVTISVTEL